MTVDAGHLAIASDPDARAPWRRIAEALVVAGALALIWWSAGNHPLHSPDEGRYASVSDTMSRAESWLVPHFRGAPHLTKPPLTYWLQASTIEALGRSELAVRLPSLVAGSLTVLVLWWFVRRVRGPEMATLAVGLYSVMPLPLFISRLATPDALLNLCWFAALACGALAVHSRRRAPGASSWTAIAWLLLAWLWMALAALTKGPIAPAPFVILFVWLALARRWRDLRWLALHSVWAAALALAPIAIWVWKIAQQHPEAWQVWREQFIDRAVMGSPAQPLAVGASRAVAESASGAAEPFWFYLPVLLAGFFPATCALTLPWFNMRLRDSLRAFTHGDLRALLLVAVVGPLLFFSVAKGKMPAYIVPVGAPLAMLVAGALARVLGAAGPTREPRAGNEERERLSSQVLADEPLDVYTLPDVRNTFFVASLLAAIGGISAGLVLAGRDGAIAAMPFMIVPVAALLVALCWNREGSSRRIGLLVLWLAVGGALWRLERLEDAVLIEHRMGAREMVERVQRVTGSSQPQFVIYSFRNPTIDFYCGADPLMVWSVGDLRGVWPKLRPDHVILLPKRTWEWIGREYPRLAGVLVPFDAQAGGSAFDPSGSIWNRWPGKPTVLLRMTGQAPEDEGRPDAQIAPEPHE